MAVNPLTGKTNEQLLAESTRVANQAAQTAGLGTFQQGVGLVPPQPQSPLLGANIAPGEPFRVDIPDTFTSEALTQPTTRQDITSALAEFQRQQQDFQQRQLGLLGPSAAEQQLNQQLADLRAQADKQQLETKAGLLDIEEEPISAGAIGGRQQEFTKREALKLEAMQREETNLLRRLGLAQEARQAELTAVSQAGTFLQQSFDTQLKVQEMLQNQEDTILARADRLSTNARQTLATILSNFKGLDLEDLDLASQNQLAQLSMQAGVPLDLLVQGMKAVKDQQAFENALAAQKVGTEINLGNILSQIQGGSFSEEQQRQIIKQAIGNLPAGQQDSAFQAVATFKNGQDILNLLDKGVKTGPISGRLREGLDIFGVPIIPGKRALGFTNIEENQFDAATTAFTANFIKAISGVQVSDREREFLLKALPSPNNQEAVNRENVSTLLNFLRNKYELQLGIPFGQFPDAIPLPEKRLETLENLFNQFN